MTSFASILSTLGDQPKTSTTPAPNRPPTPGRPKAPASKVPSNGLATAQAPKRKAEGDLDGVPAKASRKLDPAKFPDRQNGASRTLATPASSKPSTSSTNPIPYRGTAREGGAAAPVARPVSVAKPVPIAKPTPKPLAVAAKASSNPAQSTSKPSTPTTVVAPKKGSYKEMIARAMAQQAQVSQIGVIKHKKVEKLASKKDRLAQQAEARAEAKNKGVVAKDGKRVQPAHETKGRLAEPTKESKKPAELGYRGTMRPSAAEPTYKGTMKQGVTAKARPSAHGTERSRSYDNSYRGSAAASRGKDKGRMGRYNGYSEGEEEEDEEDYYSDESSDMEAAAFEVDEEEDFSLRVARKEDLAAQREEEDLKRRKEERRKAALQDGKKRRG